MDIDLLSRDLYQSGPEGAYRWLHEHAPMFWSDAAGVWGVASHELVLEAERLPELLSNEARGSRPFTPKNSSMIDRDDPRHRLQRRFVQPVFAPKLIRARERHIREISRELVRAALERETFDLVNDLAAPLPTMMIAEMLGMNPDARATLQHWMDTLVGAADGEQYVNDEVISTHMEFVVATLGLMQQRRGCPGNDMISILVNEQIEGEYLDDDSLCSEALLLLVGGGETTRNVIAGGLHALLRHPVQLEYLLSNIDDSDVMTRAIEECLRWVSPVLNMNRTATRDFEFAGEEVSEGDQVLLMYAAANRDPAVFDAPYAFDISRSPNPHLAFGSGVHFCLGANLARLEVRVMFEEILPHLGALQLATDGDPQYSWSTFIRGITSLPVTAR